MFIKKLSELDVFSLKPGDPFYGSISDPFEDENVSKDIESSPYIYCMLPTPKEFTQRIEEQKFAPLISICLPDAEKSSLILRKELPTEIFGKSVSRINADERSKIIGAITQAFSDSFVGGISVPMDSLCVKQGSLLKTTYSTAMSIMLIPLLRMHADAYIRHVSIRIPAFGGNDFGNIGKAKELAKAMGYGKESDVDLFNSSQKELWLCFRFIYWATYKAHNRGDFEDLVELERNLSNR